MRPSECALLLAIPVDQREFASDFASGTDFVHGYAARFPGADAESTWLRYRVYADLCAAVAREAADAGVAVARRVTIKDLEAALTRFSVVTLVAHFRGPDVTATDVRNPHRIIRASGDIRAVLSRAEDVDWPGPPIAVDAGTVADWLNGVIDVSPMSRPDRPGSGAQGSGRTVRALVARCRRRRAIEAVVQDALDPGIGIEMQDGFWTVEEVDRRLPKLLTATLDLTVCESAVLAELLRGSRRGGVILANASPTSADFRLALYRQAIKLMKKCDMPYAEAALKLRKRLKESLCQH